MHRKTLLMLGMRGVEEAKKTGVGLPRVLSARDGREARSDVEPITGGCTISRNPDTWYTLGEGEGLREVVEGAQGGTSRGMRISVSGS